MFKKLKELFFKKTEDRKRSSKETGDYGEKIALKYLKKKKYKLVAKNYTALKCEIDIIMLQKNTLVFVEVKSRQEKSCYGSAAEAVDFRKQNNIKKAAQAFLKSKKLTDIDVRFDVVEVYLKEQRVNHIENAFY